MQTTKPKLQRQNATVNAILIEQELVKDVSHRPERSEAELRKLCKQTDLPANWDTIYTKPPNPRFKPKDYDFDAWKAAKIADGTWIF